MIFIGLMIISTLFGAFGSLYLKKGSKNVKGILSFVEPSIIIGISLYGLSTLIYLWLLRTVELSVLYPMTALTYVWVILLSKYKLGEKIDKYKILSIFMILMGIIFVT